MNKLLNVLLVALLAGSATVAFAQGTSAPAAAPKPAAPPPAAAPAPAAAPKMAPAAKQQLKPLQILQGFFLSTI